MFWFTTLLNVITLFLFSIAEDVELWREYESRPKSNKAWVRPPYYFANYTKTKSWKARSTIYRIVGGTTIKQGDFPWMASLQYKSQHFCGATLINSNWVVTAAHCVDANGPKPFQVVLGEYNLSVEEETERHFDVERIIVHEGWNPRLLVNDIALVKLKGTFNETDEYIQPIDLPDKSLALTEGQICVATGWGLLNISQQNVSDLPQMVDMPLVSRFNCQKAYTQASIGNICAGGQRGKGICSGDSGGPFHCFLNDQWVYVGLDSFTALCALPEYPSVFTKVYYFADWLQVTMARSARGKTFPFD